MVKLFALIGAVGIAFIGVLYTTMSWAFVGNQVYHWFVLPTFPNLPNLTNYQMLGIMLFSTILTNRRSSTKYKDLEEDKWHNGLNIIFNPWLTLLFSYWLYLYIN